MDARRGRRWTGAVALLPRFDVLHLDLHVRAAAAADMDVVRLQHAPDALVEFEQGCPARISVARILPFGGS